MSLCISKSHCCQTVGSTMIKKSEWSNYLSFLKSILKQTKMATLDRYSIGQVIFNVLTIGTGSDYGHNNYIVNGFERLMLQY